MAAASSHHGVCAAHWSLCFIAVAIPVQLARAVPVNSTPACEDPLLHTLTSDEGLAFGLNVTIGDPRPELEERLRRVQVAMTAAQLDAILLTTEANVRYFTGYHSPFWQSPTRPWFVVLPRAGLPVAVVPTIGEDAFGRAFTGKVITWPAPRPEDDGISELVAAITEMPLVSGRIGAELGPEMTVRMPISDFKMLESTLAEGNRIIVDGSPALQHTRLIKSSMEVAKVEATCQAMSAAYREVPFVLTEGMTEKEACNAVKKLFLSKGVDDTPYVICRSGPVSYSDIIGHPTLRRLKRGDVFILDSGCQIDGYYCDFNRNFPIGPPAQQFREAYDKLYEATESALNITRPGVTFRDLYGAMAKTLGMEDTEGGVGRMGHSVGLQLTEWPSIHPKEGTVLAEGMVISIEPSIPIGDDGRFVVTEEEIVVTENGYRLLSERAPVAVPYVAVADEAECRMKTSTL